MPRADGAVRLLDAAVALGAARGVSALSVQAIANAAGVSKALVLYHYADKPRLLQAVYAHVGAASVRRIAAAVAAVDPADPLESWRALARDEVQRGELALLMALARDVAVRETGAPGVGVVGRDRETAAAALVEAIFAAFELTPRVTAPLLGRTLLRHLDGLAVAYGPTLPAVAAAPLDAELDTFALGLLGLGA